MAAAPGLVVAQVRPGSIAAEMEIEPGDRITRINGQDVEDLVDFHFFSSDDYLEMEVIKASGDLWQLELEKELHEDFGLEFVSVSSRGIKRCRNKCLFCFVDQMPPGMRPTLYEKDDDYRLSLTQGSFMTLTNLSEEELNRIIRLHLSPLYVSVHATEPGVRQKLLGNQRAGLIMEQLHALARAGITLHTQIVLIPGINDGAVLAKSIADLKSLWPQVQSIAVVPVGLTAHRSGLAVLPCFDREGARQVIALGSKRQEEFRQELGSTFLYFSDEFYVEADLTFPGVEAYDDFSQLENGVGLSRLFIDEVASLLPTLPRQAARRRVHVVTGVSAGKIMLNLIESVCHAVDGLEVQLHILENKFFGPSVTVAGLLTGSDLISGLSGLEGETVLIPRVMLKAGEQVFLDDQSLEQVSNRLRVRLTVVELSGHDFLRQLLGFEFAEDEVKLSG